MIFLTITGSWTAAVFYDKREKKRVQKKWCDLVAHISQEPLPVRQMRRKLTVFLAAPPGDGIRPSREYFKEYVKPVLVAAAMDYDVIEGRKEGDVRYGTAEQIRRLRRKKGQTTPASVDAEMDTEAAIDVIREKMHLEPEPGVRGDLVLGRHTWKEYIRGLHEGWLGPVEEPVPPKIETEIPPIQPQTGAGPDDPEPIPGNPEPEKKAEEEKEKKPPFPPPAYLSTDKYSSAVLSPDTPGMLEPSQPIYQQHILGFLKFPQRMYHFLNRRQLADRIGGETAAIVLAASRPYAQGEAVSGARARDMDPFVTNVPDEDDATQTAQNWEQSTLLQIEESRWHKSVRKPRKEGDDTERVWLNDVVIDSRIGARMSKFELNPEEEERARRIASGAETTRAIPVHDLRTEKVVLGDVDYD